MVASPGSLSGGDDVAGSAGGRVTPILKAISGGDEFPLLTSGDVIAKLVDDLDEMLPQLVPDDPATSYLRDLRSLLALQRSPRRHRPRGR